MAFNPDEYLASKQKSQGFDPDAYLSTKQPKERTWGETAGEAATSFLPSVGRMAGGIAETVMHPIDTAYNLGKLVVGAGERGMENIVGQFNPELVAFNKQINKPSEAEQLASGVGEFYGKRYGSEQGLKEALATDPAGVMADMATLLTGGGAALTKAGISPIGAMMQKTAAAIDPLALTAKAAGGAAKLAGKGISAGLGVTTGAGSEAIKQAYQAGKRGGQPAESFQANLRGTSPMDDVLNTAKQDLANMNSAKTAEYRSNMKAVNEIKEPLTFENIDNAVANAFGTVTYKGKIKNDKGAQVLKEISDAIGDWKQLNPSEYHTPEGIDALKQVVGGIVEGIPFEEKTARMVGNNIYHSIKNEIAKKAPIYDKTMSDYSQASNQIKEIEKALSLGSKASADTAMRKLQSLMRNNVSTNYGQRVKLAQELEKQGGGEIMPALAGQALSDLAPRGLARIGGGLAIGGSVLNPATLAALPLASPRLVGEASYYAGKAAKGKNALAELARKSKVSPRVMANMFYQMNQPK